MQRLLAQVLVLIAFGVAPAAVFACTIPAILQRDLDRIPFVATGVFHIVKSEEHALPGPVGGYEVKGIVELREARVLRNRRHHRGPILIAFGFHAAPDCTFGHLPGDGQAVKVWLRSPAKRGEPFELFHIDALEPASTASRMAPAAPTMPRISVVSLLDLLQRRIELHEGHVDRAVLRVTREAA